MWSRKEVQKLKRANKKQRTFRPQLEILETRIVPSSSPPAPAVISVNSLNLGSLTAAGVETMTVIPNGTNGQTVYLGLGDSHDHERMNFGVLHLNKSGKPIGPVTFYTDNQYPLGFGASESVYSIVVSSNHHKLYLGSYEISNSNSPPSFNDPLTVYDLDATGDPIGTPRSYAGNDTSSPAVFAMTLSPTHSLLYVADNQAGIDVFNLDSTGEPMAPPVSYVTPAEGGNNYHKTAIAVSPDGKTMYLGTVGGIDPQGDLGDVLEVVKLDSSGLPTNAVNTYVAGSLDPNNPTSHLYLNFDYTPQALYRKPWISDPGMPSSYPLQIWSLGTDGLPTTPQPTLSSMSGRAIAVDGNRNTLYVAGDDTFPDAYTSSTVTDGASLLASPLDPTSGQPTGQPALYPSLYLQSPLLMCTGGSNPVLLSENFASAPTGNQVSNFQARVNLLHTDGSTSTVPVWLGSQSLGNLTLGQLSSPISLDPFLKNQNGQQLVKLYAWTQANETGVLSQDITAACPGDQMDIPLGILENFTYPTDRPVPFKVQIDNEVMEVTGINDAANPNHAANTLTVVRGLNGSAPAHKTGAAVDLFGVSLQVQLQIYKGDANNPANLFKTLTGTVQGNVLEFLLPGYGFEPPGKRATDTELYSHHAQQVYLASAQKVGLTTADRPKQFTIGAFQILAGQASMPQLQAEAQTISLLGINTIGLSYPANGWGALPPNKVNSVLDQYGLQEREAVLPDYSNDALTNGSIPGAVPPLSGPNARPDGYFYFKLAESGAALDQWAQDAQLFQASIGNPAIQIVSLHLLDEPQWDLGMASADIKNDSAWLADFRSYVVAQATNNNLQPSDFGLTSWSDPNLVPIDATQAVDSGSNHLFYWTVRYFADQAAQGTALVKQTLQNYFPNLQTLTVNVSDNYFPSGGWYIPGGAGNGGFDLLATSAVNGATPWTEDYFGDGMAEQWSYQGAYLRAAAMEGAGTQPFGAYLSVNSIGGEPGGASYKILSLIGQGAKALNLYAFGPAFNFPGNCWSEGTVAYGPVANALKLVSRAEDLLYPGQPERGKVAIYLPSASHLWDTAADPYYIQETQYLYDALTQSGYSVDFVNVTDLANGTFAARGYTTLYVTGPNMATAAQAQVQTWVQNGGTLVVTPGAAVADEYNNPSTTLDPVLGLNSRMAVRDVFDGSRTPSSSFTPLDPEFGSSSMELVGPLDPLQLNGAQEDGTLQSGSPGITLNKYGSGTAIAYAFFPGLQYVASADNSPALGYFDPLTLPSGWGDLQRQVAVEPAVLAGTPKPVVVSTPGVEADVLTSDKGIAIVLLNWTDQPIAQLTVTVPNAAAFQRIRSAQGVALHTQVNADGSLTITLPIQNVDVLLLDEAATTTTLSASSNPSTFGQSVTVTAAVMSAGNLATGRVTIKDGSTVLGTGTLNKGTDTLSTAALLAGNHSITVVCAGDAVEFNVSNSATLTDVVKSTGQMPASPHMPADTLMAFTFGNDNNPLDMLVVDPKRQVFDEAWPFHNVFSPRPGTAPFLNSDQVLQNLSADKEATWSADVLSDLLDSNNQELLRRIVPDSFLSQTVLEDVIAALQISRA